MTLFVFISSPESHSTAPEQQETIPVLQRNRSAVYVIEESPSVTAVKTGKICTQRQVLDNSANNNSGYTTSEN